MYYKFSQHNLKIHFYAHFLHITIIVYKYRDTFSQVRHINIYYVLAPLNNLANLLINCLKYNDIKMNVFVTIKLTGSISLLRFNRRTSKVKAKIEHILSVIKNQLLPEIAIEDILQT